MPHENHPILVDAADGTWLSSENLRSQWGQDAFIFTNLMNHDGGTFFEVGAHEGIALSNTYFFEKECGWKGILVEMQPHFFPDIHAMRPGSQCFNCALGQENLALLYLDAGDRSGLLRYFEKEAMEYLEMFYQDYDDKPEFRVHWVKCRRTMDVFGEANMFHIDYFSLDVEGAEMIILQSIDFNRVSIDLFTIEDNSGFWKEHRAFLCPLGYRFLGHLGVDGFFIHERRLRKIESERGAAHIEDVRSKMLQLPNGS